MSRKPMFFPGQVLLLVLTLSLSGCHQPANDPAREHPIGGRPADRQKQTAGQASTHHHNNNSVGQPAASLPFDRHPDRLVLTRHAKCRMGCRHITEKEIREILDRGRINDRKSEPEAHPDPKYAIEGNTDEGQHLRIVVAVPGHSGSVAGHVLVVVTCIELDVEWQCDCH